MSNILSKPRTSFIFTVILDLEGMLLHRNLHCTFTVTACFRFSLLFFFDPVVDVPSPDVLDTCFASMPMKDQMNTSFTPMRPYEDFAADVWRWVGEKRDSAIVEGVKKAGLYYLLISDVEYEGKTITKDRGLNVLRKCVLRRWESKRL